MRKGQKFGAFLQNRRSLSESGGPASLFEADAHLETFKAALISLDGSRVANLLEEYRQRHGRPAREMAFLTCHNWREGGPAYQDATTARLFDLLPRYLTGPEKLFLLRRLRAEAPEQAKPSSVRLTLSRSGDLAAVASQILPKLRQMDAADLPASLPGLQRWFSDNEMQTLARIAEEADRLLAAQRLADLIVRLAQLFRLRELADAETQIYVAASFVIPTATIALEFRPSFWREPMNENRDKDQNVTDQDFLVRLQDLALTQEWQNGAMSYVDFVMRTLTPLEQEKLRSVAVAEGLRTEILLRELHVKTLAAKADIELTLETTQKLKDQHHSGRIISEHATASGTTQIEVIVEPCPLLRPLTRWRKPKRLES